MGMEDSRQNQLRQDPAWIRGLTRPRLSRRQLITGAAGTMVSLSAAQILAACGLAGTQGTGYDPNFDWPAWWKKQKSTGKLNFANWPLYIDTEKGKSPSLDKFQKETGIKVNYEATIQDNGSFFSTISPVLQAEQPTGYDLIVLTNGWYLTEMIMNRWLTPLDHSRMPNFEKYAGPIATELAYDPKLTYCAVWQAGSTAIAYNSKYVTEEIDSVDALFDPKYKGKIGMLTDPDEVGMTGLIKMGIKDPSASTIAEWKQMAKIMADQRSLVRQYYDQSYIQALENGDVVISQAYSGDIFQAQNSGFPNLKYVIPKEGAGLWRDNCLIPLHAANPVDAVEWINFYYQPEIEAMIEDWVGYISPVPGAKAVIANQLGDPATANSPLVFPTAEEISRLKEYPIFDTFAKHQEWLNLLDPIIQS